MVEQEQRKSRLRIELQWKEALWKWMMAESKFRERREKSNRIRLEATNGADEMESAISWKLIGERKEQEVEVADLEHDWEVDHICPFFCLLLLLK